MRQQQQRETHQLIVGHPPEIPGVVAQRQPGDVPEQFVQVDGIHPVDRGAGPQHPPSDRQPRQRE
eukprot:7126547-Pyramimonas_sp.AAC.1